MGYIVEAKIRNFGSKWKIVGQWSKFFPISTISSAVWKWVNHFKSLAIRQKERKMKKKRRRRRRWPYWTSIERTKMLTERIQVYSVSSSLLLLSSFVCLFVFFAFVVLYTVNQWSFNGIHHAVSYTTTYFAFM